MVEHVYQMVCHYFWATDVGLIVEQFSHANPVVYRPLLCRCSFASWWPLRSWRVKTSTRWISLSSTMQWASGQQSGPSFILIRLFFGLQCSFRNFEYVSRSGLHYAGLQPNLLHFTTWLPRRVAWVKPRKLDEMGEAPPGRRRQDRQVDEEDGADMPEGGVPES